MNCKVMSYSFFFFFEFRERNLIIMRIELVAAAQPKTLEQRLKELISKSSVMLFMKVFSSLLFFCFLPSFVCSQFKQKGSPDLPKCGFSSKMVELLRQNKIEVFYLHLGKVFFFFSIFTSF